MPTSLELLAHIRAESARFGEVLAATDPAARVPTCPDWSAADLLWHLAEVHAFWAAIVGGRLSTPDGVEPVRAEGYAELVVQRERATVELLDALADAGTATPVWTWWDADQTTGFVLRWQAHEALMHRIDAELAAGVEVAPIDPALAADGIDVVLSISYAWQPSWATYAADGSAIELVATDRRRRWRLHGGRVRGTSPDTGNEYDRARFRLVPVAEPDVEANATVSGAAADLDRWLWSRGDTRRLVRQGSAAVLSAFDAVVAAGVQ